ncbi:hypothetical protein T492DRAFT_973545 [Pavlovales sp. CCMP2436]|nr:hypothetical protein T492DRAFT_973545 [Pavlovales sp. CCMP2436]
MEARQFDADNELLDTAVDTGAKEIGAADTAAANTGAADSWAADNGSHRQWGPDSSPDGLVRAEASYAAEPFALLSVHKATNASARTTATAAAAAATATAAAIAAAAAAATPTAVDGTAKSAATAYARANGNGANGGVASAIKTGKNVDDSYREDGTYSESIFGKFSGYGGFGGTPGFTASAAELSVRVATDPDNGRLLATIRLPPETEFG